MTPGEGIEDEHSPFQAAKLIVAAILVRNVAQTEVDENRLASMDQPAVGIDVLDILRGEVALGEPLAGMG